MNNPIAQFNLGLINYDNRYIKRNLEKAIHYFQLAADQNNIMSQFFLGEINYKYL